MNASLLRSATSGDIGIAALCRSSLLALYTRSIFLREHRKSQNRSFSRPSGVTLHCWEDLDEDGSEGELSTADSSPGPY